MACYLASMGLLEFDMFLGAVSSLILTAAGLILAWAVLEAKARSVRPRTSCESSARVKAPTLTTLSITSEHASLSQVSSRSTQDVDPDGGGGSGDFSGDSEDPVTTEIYRILADAIDVDPPIHVTLPHASSGRTDKSRNADRPAPNNPV